MPDVKSGRANYDKKISLLMKKAVVHYHPDRIDVDVDGAQLKVLNEEICKVLTQKYETFKHV